MAISEIAAGAERDNIPRTRLYNEDLAPTRPEQRTWGTYSFAALWIGMTHQIPTYMAAGGLIALGMNWWQAILTIAVANVLILIPILLNSHVGAKYGIPFPVVVRAPYGVFGANLPALMRAVVACGWFGIQTWIGGQAIHQAFAVLVPGWSTWGGTIGGQTFGMWVGFAIFWLINIYIIYRGMETLRHFENWAGPLVLVFAGALLVWMVVAAGGWGPILEQPSKFNTLGEFIPVFIPAMTGMMGMWSTLSLNMPDFTRFARDQRAQLIGQSIALPTTMTLFAAMGVGITSASAVVFGEPIWDPVVLAGQFTVPIVVVVAMFNVALATLSVNIAANVVSPSYDFANVLPKYIDLKRGGLITGILAILFQPWHLLADPSGFIFNWLLGYGGGMGAVAGVMIADYWLVRRRELRIRDLYLEFGCYRFQGGWNWRAVAATAVGLFLAWGGLLIPPLRPLYDYGWFAGFFAALLAYWLLNTVGGVPTTKPIRPGSTLVKADATSDERF